MQVKLIVNFDVGNFGEVIIDNPAYLPVEGEIFNCEWPDFVKDKEQLRELKAFNDNHCWMVQRLSSTYSKDMVVCIIVLIKDTDWENYKKEFKM